MFVMTVIAQVCLKQSRADCKFDYALGSKKTLERRDMIQTADSKTPLCCDRSLPLANVTDSVKSWTLIAPRELAERWRMSVRTLDRWRAESYGPGWLALGGRVLYRLEDVMAFEEGQHRPNP